MRKRLNTASPHGLLCRLFGIFLLVTTAGPSLAGAGKPALIPGGEVLPDVEALLAAIPKRSAVLAIAYSPDGKTLASGSGDNTVRLWDAATGRELARLEGHSDSVFSVAWSPDGATL